MPNYTQFLNDLNVKIQNKSNSIPVSVKTFVNQILRNEVSIRDYVSTIRHTKTYRTIYNDVNRYPLLSDMKSEGLIDIQKYKNYNQGSGIKYRKVSPNVFRTMAEIDTVAFDYSDGISWLLGNFNTANDSILISTMDSITSEGTWSASDNGENIQNEKIIYVSGSGSISCDLATGGTILSIENSTLNAKDLSDIDKIFLWTYFPTVQNLTSVTLLYGSDNSNYYTSTATFPFITYAFQTGLNLISFDKGVATGTPDEDKITYIKISLNFSATPTILTGFKFDNIIASKGDAMEQSYYSKYPWKNTAGTWILNSTSNEDELNATELEYNVWLNRCAYEASKAIPLSDTIISLNKQDWLDSKEEYFNRYPSRRIKERNYMYRPTINTSKRFARRTYFDNVNNSI